MTLFSPSRRWLSTVLRLSALTLCALLAPSLVAQVAGTGTIQGIVTDSTGAFVPNASVTLTEEATHVVRAAKTDSAGAYVFPNIEVGTYTLTVASQGFQTFSQVHNVLEVGSNIGIDAHLAVGGEKQTVTVEATGVALQTEDAKFKQTIDQREVTGLPLNGRRMTDLLTITGATAPAPGGDFTGSKYTYATISISIAGGQGNTTLWRLDGGDNNDYMANGNLPFPFPDAVSQFSVESTALGAQDGMHSGGMVNVVTRSGTNQYHGTAFEFIRNNIINATNFFSTTKDALHQHQFGGTIGGPIIHDKLFAFGGYQHLLSHATTNNVSAYAPTPAMLAGDFSACDAPPSTPGGTGQLYDPLTGALLPGNKYPTQPTYDPSSLALVKYMPTQLQTGDPCGKVVYSTPNNQSDDQVIGRVDWTVTPKHHFYGRYFYDGYDLPAGFSSTNIFITTAAGQLQRVNSFTMGEDWTITNNFVNSAHVSILRRSNNRGYAAEDINANTIGVNMYQAVKNGLQIAATRFTIGGGTNSVAHFNDNALVFDDDITWLKGKHQFVFGGEFVRNQLNISNAYESNGTFTFSSSGIYSGNGPNGGSKKGEAMLDFLAGALSGFEQSKFQQNALRAPIPSLYVQDTFHATREFTAIAGIRWSPNIFPYDYFNRGSVFDQNAFLAGQTSSIYTNAPAGTFYYGEHGVPRPFTKSAWMQFSPNVGFAWDVSGRGMTVFRGGAELIYDQVNFFTGQRTQQNPPFATTVANSATASSGPMVFNSPWSRGAVTTNPYPQPFHPPANVAYFPQTQYIVLPTQFHPSYTEQWTLSWQQQFPRGWMGQIQYIGNHTVHAPTGFPINPAVYIPGVWGAGGTGCSGVVLTGPAAQKPGSAGSACSTTSNYTSRYALAIANPTWGNFYKGGGGGSILVDYHGWANYEGLVATLQHRISNSFSFLMNHTWSKCLNINDAQGDTAGTNVENPNNYRLDYGPCGSDYRNIFNLVVVAQSHVTWGNRLVNGVLSDWEASPIIHITSGAPYNVTAGTDLSLTNVGNDRPNIVPGVDPYLHGRILGGNASTNSSTRGFLNPAAFSNTTVPAGTYGNLSRNAVRGRPYYQIDGALSRLFPIHESLNLQLRLECFNILNHPSFGTPTGAVNNANFGTVSSTSGEGPRVFQGSIKFNF